MGLLVAGGAGFLGSHFIRYVVESHGPRVGTVACLDRHPPGPVLKGFSYRDFKVIRADISSPGALEDGLKGDTDTIVNFADAPPSAQLDPTSRVDFLRTNVEGVLQLLETARQRDKALVHVSTTKVYGGVPQGSAKETDPLRPRTVHAASKAAAEHVLRAYRETYGLSIKVARVANVFGPFQSLDHLIPHFITSALRSQSLLVYGEGLHVRDRIPVVDACSAIDFVWLRGKPGEVYNVGTGKATAALEVAKGILEMLQQPLEFINFLEGAPAVERRISLDVLKLQALGWRPQKSFHDALWEAIKWYEANPTEWRSSLQVAA